MARFRIFPYKQGSRSAKMLALALQEIGCNARVLRREGSTYNPSIGDVIVNWGSSSVPMWPGVDILNSTLTVAQCKLKSLTELKTHGVQIPNFLTDLQEAKDYIQARDGNCTLVCRTKLRGHSGDGIVLANTADELVAAPLYTEYVKKKHEFRVHVVKTSANTYQAFFVQRKAKKTGVENPNWQIRNLAGGFVFVECENDITPLSVIEQSLKAMKALDLDFGAVDVLWNAYESKAYVLEVNTACGLEHRTALKYAKVLSDRYSLGEG